MCLRLFTTQKHAVTKPFAGGQAGGWAGRHAALTVNGLYAHPRLTHGSPPVHALAVDMLRFTLFHKKQQDVLSPPLSSINM